MARETSRSDTKSKAQSLVRTARQARVAQKKRGTELIAEIRSRLDDVGSEFLEIGRRLKALYDESIHLALDYDSFEAMLEGEGLGSRAQAFKLMAVAAVFGEAGIADFGIERAYALISYTRATPEDDDAATLFADNALVAGKPVREHSVTDLTKARQDLTREAAASNPTREQRARAALEKKVTRLIAKAHKAQALPKADIDIRGQKITATWTLDAFSEAD
jgi:hypothetical protein